MLQDWIKGLKIHYFAFLYQVCDRCIAACTLNLIPMEKNSLFSRPEESIAETLQDSTAQLSELIVYNDDFNTFDWVIQCFIEICNHTFEQSEQLSLLIHYKGKAVVKTDILEVLQPMKDALVDRGLSAVIESLQVK